MDDWGKFNETSLPKKETFYGHLNMEDIADADYAHFKREFFFFKLGEHHDFYVQSKIILLTDVYENFQDMCLDI